MKKEMKIFKDKEGNKLTFKEFTDKWKTGIKEITPIQKIKTQILGTRIILIGLLAGLVMSIIGWKNLWWVGIILIGALFNTAVQYLGLKQQKKLLDNLEKQFELPEEEKAKEELKEQDSIIKGMMVEIMTKEAKASVALDKGQTQTFSEEPKKEKQKGGDKNG